MNSPERLAWLMGGSKSTVGAAGKMLRQNIGNTMFMYAGGGAGHGGKNYRPSFEKMLEEAMGIAERANGDRVSLQLDDFGLTGAYWLDGNLADLHQDSESLPPVKMVNAIGGGWIATNLDDITNVLQRRLTGYLQYSIEGGLQSGIFGGILQFSEKHFNGSVGLVGYSAEAYKKIPNSIKRKYAYKLSKITGWKSGEIFQKAKSFSKSTAKLTSKLGPYGIALTTSVILYEARTDNWDAHTFVNGALLIGGAAATFFAAPAILTGIALYGIGDYFFDFSRKIDDAVGRKSRLW